MATDDPDRSVFGDSVTRRVVVVLGVVAGVLVLLLVMAVLVVGVRR